MSFTTNFPKNFYTIREGKVFVDPNIGAANSFALSSLDYTKPSNRSMLGHIASRYAEEIGVEGPIGVKDVGKDEDKTIASTKYDKDITISVINGSINKHLTDSKNLQNVLVHENAHRTMKGHEDNLEHIDVYLTQVDHATWTEGTTAFRTAMIKNVEKYLNDALTVDKFDPLLVQDKINQLNKVSYLTDVEFKLTNSKVKYTPINAVKLDEVEIKSK